MRKTITVTVSRDFEHPVLLKKLHRTKKYLVHDEAEKANVGDKVTIRHGKPHSKRKSFSLTSIDVPYISPKARVLQALEEQALEKQAVEESRT
ncbi:hypothetical protein VHUM_02606 [Vanrija humicola]|uniref:30S ribosomal protein S17 n=1 Tax=Vanrija humicola TaxID=5417 RepID=A0A7D8V0K0_VANHU|nr:hypothetical protein VHUM_02606 [Vanrija humicola]